MQWTRREWTLAVAGAAASCNQAPQAEEAATAMTPEELLAQSYVIDLHCDTPDRLASDSFDLGEDYPYGQVDIPKMRRGGVGGVDHVGLGSDFDGVTEELPTGMEDISKIPNLIPGLRERGFSDDAIVKMLGGNTLRVMREVEAYAHAGKESA